MFRGWRCGRLSDCGRDRGSYRSQKDHSHCFVSISGPPQRRRCASDVSLITARFIALVGTAIQAGSVVVGMFIAGRILAGVAVGMLYSAIPTYQSEIAPPATRGWIVGLHSLGLSVGYTVSSYIVRISTRQPLRGSLDYMYNTNSLRVLEHTGSPTMANGVFRLPFKPSLPWFSASACSSSPSAPAG
jgi:MFS family permease